MEPRYKYVTVDGDRFVRGMQMIDFYTSPTPNGLKVLLFLEEIGDPYNLHWVNLGTGEQFKPAFLKISPNNRIPAMVDTDPADGGEAVSVFESGAVLVYLAEKYGRFMPTSFRGRKTALEWLFWQVGGLGPMCGQNHHFVLYAPEPIPYAIDRYVKETNRLHGVLDRRLKETGAFVLGDEYSVADMASYPWVAYWERQKQNLDEFPDLRRWLEAIAARPATQRSQAIHKERSSRSTLSDATKKMLFGQTAANVKERSN